jgi:hydroxyacylglutathione hydrolase
VRVVELPTPGLGDTSYLLAHEGLGIVVDPQRDTGRFRAAVAEAGVELRMVLETHLHNDYVSGARELARRSAAELVLPAGTGAAYPYRPAFHLEELEVGAGAAVRPLHTPGHTPEHTSYLVLLEGRPAALFSGGSLLAGSAGRTDLLGPERARQLAVLQHGSLRRLGGLPGSVALYPTHGAGSFCTTAAAGPGSSTIERERAGNPVLRYARADAFADEQLAGLPPYPGYYRHMSPINLLGPAPMPAGEPRELAPDAVVEALGRGARVVDGRPRGAFARGHAAGSIGVELGDEFATWVGWLVPFGTPLVLVLDPGQDAERAAVDLARIGVDELSGLLRMDAWRRAGLPVASFELVDLVAFAALAASGEAGPVLDVRAPAEWDAGHLDGSVHAYLPDLSDGVPEVPRRAGAALVACASGFRSAIAAGLLERAGVRPTVLDGSGIPEALERAARRPGGRPGRRRP